MEELKLNIEQLEQRIAPGLSLGGGICVDIGIGIGVGGGGNANPAASGGVDSGSGSGSGGSCDDEADNSHSS